MRISLHFCRSIKKLSLKYQVGWSCEYFSKVHFLIINISFNCHLSCLFCWLKPSELLQFVIYQSTFPNIVFLSCLNICILLKVFKTDFKNINATLITLLRVFFGFVFGVLIGFLLGITTHISKVIYIDVYLKKTRKYSF